MKKRAMFVLAIITAIAFCLVTSQPAMASDEEEILEVAENFAKAFNTADLELMLSLHRKSPEISKYTPSANGAFLTQGWEAVEKGWKGTLEQPVGSFVVTLHNPQVTLLEGNVAVMCGYLIMTVNPPAAVEQTTNQMRLTLVVQKDGGRWLIVHEHTSMLPTE